MPESDSSQSSNQPDVSDRHAIIEPRDRDSREAGQSPQSEDSAEKTRHRLRLDQYVLLVLVVAFVCLAGYRWYQHAKPLAHPLVERDQPGPGYVIKLNSAHFVELSQLVGIDGQLAKRIVAWRDQHGAFRSLDELKQIEGIDQAVVDANRQWLSTE